MSWVWLVGLYIALTVSPWFGKVLAEVFISLVVVVSIVELLLTPPMACRRLVSVRNCSIQIMQDSPRTIMKYIVVNMARNM